MPLRARSPIDRRRLAGALVLTAALTAPTTVAAAGPVPARSATGLPIAPEILDSRWAASWLACPGAPERDPGVFRFRKLIELGSVPPRFVVHVSGDQRFVLFANGRRVGAGPARGDLDFWRFETFDLAPHLAPGRNLLVALVWSFGTQAPGAQIGDRIGFVLQGDGPERAHGGQRRLAGSARPSPGTSRGPRGCGPCARRRTSTSSSVRASGSVAARYDWDWARLAEAGAARGALAAGRRLRPAEPAQHQQGSGLRALARGPAARSRRAAADGVPRRAGRRRRASRRASRARCSSPTRPLTIPPRTKASLLLDRRELVTAYPELAFSGGDGARLRLSYQEALVGDGFRKGHRDVIAGKQHARLLGRGAARRRAAAASSTRCGGAPGAICSSTPRPADEPLVLESLKAHATGYPFELHAPCRDGRPVIGPDPRRWAGARRGCARTRPTSTARTTSSTSTSATRASRPSSPTPTTGDDRLARQAIAAFERSRRSDGITSSRYPASAPQYIPPFSLLWIGMVRDFWMLPRRSRLRARAARRHAHGARLVPGPAAPKRAGRPLCPGGTSSTGRPSSPAACRRRRRTASRRRSRCSSWPRCATRPTSRRRSATPGGRELYRSKAQAAADAVRPAVLGRGARPRRRSTLEGPLQPADEHPRDPQPTRSRSTASPRSLDRVLAAGMPSVREGARPPPGAPQQRLTQASYYFRFYLARALEKLGRGDEYLAAARAVARDARSWASRPGPRRPSTPTRSDCHAWSAHPSYDLLTIVAGIRPAAPGFASVRIEPHLGTLDALAARMPHPAGTIEVSYHRVAAALEATITLPPGLTGELVWRGTRRPLRSGQQQLRIE